MVVGMTGGEMIIKGLYVSARWGYGVELVTGVERED